MPAKLRVKVIGFQHDADAFTGESYTQIVLAIETRLPNLPPQMASQVYPPIPKAIGWKHIMYLYIPNTKWNNQYQMWQEYDLEIDDNTGELSLKLAKENV